MIGTRNAGLCLIALILSGCNNSVTQCIELGDARTKGPEFAEVCEKALKKAPDNPAVLRYAGRASYLSGDGAAAKSRLERAVELGDAPSLLSLGILYREGVGVTADEARGCDLAAQALKRGVELATVTLGYCAGDAKDFTTAEAMFDRGHRAGIALATANLGLHYTGYPAGAPRDLKKAEPLLTQAATDPEVAGMAYRELGLIYVNGGDGVVPDPGKAERFLQQALELGDGYSRYAYARHILLPRGRPVDLKQAKPYLAEAVAEQMPEAEEMLREARIKLGELKKFYYLKAGVPICPSYVAMSPVRTLVEGGAHPLQIETVLNRFGCELTPKRTEFDTRATFKDLGNGVSVLNSGARPVYFPTSALSVEYHEGPQLAGG